MKKLFATIVSAFFALTFSAVAFAADKGSADEAVAMVKKAIAYVKANGQEKAFVEFSSAGNHFKDRGLYIFAIDFNGKTLAHSANPKLIGKDFIDLKDADGKYLIKNLIEVATSKGKGWTDFKWINPTINAIEPRSAYVEKVDDYLIASVIYR